MLIQIFGDLHFRESSPRVRIDDYLPMLVGKVEWGLEQVHPDVIILPGDIFNDCHASYNLISIVAGLFSQVDAEVFVIAGQHDQRYHTSDLSNTPLNTLIQAGVFKLLDEKGCYREEICFRGIGYSDELLLIPEPDLVSPNTDFHVLVLHRLIIKDVKLWAGQEGFTYSKTLLKENKYNLIITGDNHQNFTDVYENRGLINPGSVMRSRIDQADHEPAMYVFDTETSELERYQIPIRPFSEVVDLDIEEITRGISQGARAFADALNDDSDEFEIKYVSNLKVYMKKNDIREGVQEVIWEAVPEEEII